MKSKCPSRKLKSPEWDAEQLEWTRAASNVTPEKPLSPATRLLIVFHVAMTIAGLIANYKQIMASLGH